MKILLIQGIKYEEKKKVKIPTNLIKISFYIII